MEVKAEYRTIFAEESKEHLEAWESSLLNLEKNPGDKELINEMFRAIHTLKGSAGFIGYEKLQRLTHDLESALQDVRDGTIVLTPELIDLLFRGLDLSTRMVDSFTAGEEFDEDIEEFLTPLRDQTSGSSSEEVPLPAQRGVEAEEERTGDADTESEPTQQIETATEVTGSAANSRRYELGLFVKSSGREAFLRASLIRNRLTGIGTIVSEDPAPEILKNSGGRFVYSVILETNAAEEGIREALNVDLLDITSFAQLGEEAQESGRQECRDTTDGGTGGVTDTTARAAKAEEVVRVSVERLDTLLNLVGELVIQNSGFLSIARELKSQHGKTAEIVDLDEKTEALAKITRDLQDGIMKVRMLPVNKVFGRFYRVVRDLAKDRKKEITLDVFGAETEIDKKVMDRIGDPLVHLIRNAVDHGIESREERLAAGKAPVGSVRLGAYQNGDHICIEVSDDGRGLDKSAVLKKAVEKGLVRAEETGSLSDERLLSLIFLPGFSTTKEVSEVSGRGVGMDVVKRAIEAMSGSIRIRSSAGRGTTVTISLPLTMAIIPAVMVEVSGSTLAVPLSSVKEVLKVGEAEMKSVGTSPAICLRDEVLAVVHLRQALELGSNSNGSQDPQTPVVIVDYEERKIGLGVDRVIGTSEIVIKSLSRHYREIKGLIGASILGNGRIALIVDVETLVRQYYHAEGEEHTFTGSSIFNYQEENRGRIEAETVQEAGVNATQGEDEVDGVSEEEVHVDGAAEGSEDLSVMEEVVPEPAGTDPLAGLTEELNEGRGVLLEEIHNAGAIQASMALSKLTDREVRVSFPESQIVPLGKIADFLGGEEEPVGGLYVGIEGSLGGGILMVMPVENMLRFHDQLYRQTPGTCSSLEKVDMSGISEFGNMLSASFINAISDGTGLGVKADPPEISVDMCQPVIDSVLARFNQPGDRILLTKALIYCDESEEVVCHLLMFLEPESLKKLTAVLVDNLE